MNSIQVEGVDIVKESLVSFRQVEVGDIHDISVLYKRVGRLGSGGFGRGFKVQSKKFGDFFAVKDVYVNLESDESRKQYEREVLILGTAKHSALLSLHGCTPLHKGFKDPIIITPLMLNGSTQDMMKSCPRERDSKFPDA